MNEFLRIFVPQLQVESPIIVDILDNSKIINEVDPTVLLSASQTQETIYFVIEGVIRKYSIEDNEEKTNWFFSRGDFALSEDSFFIDSKSDEYLETTSDVRLLAIKKRLYPFN